MNEKFYKQVPPNLFDTAAQRNPTSDLDPMLCGYQILLDRLKTPRTGVMHLGGHVGQELPMYAALGFRNVVMVEPLDDEFQILQDRVLKYNQTFSSLSDFLGEESYIKAHAVKCAVSDESGIVNFYRTGVTSLSSLSKPIAGGFSYTKDSFDDNNSLSYSEVPVPCKTLDELVSELPNNWKSTDFSYLRINVQGSELKALKGAKSFLSAISIIDLETNIEPRYENNPTKRDFDTFLDKHGFQPVFGYSLGSVVGNIIYSRR